MKTGEAIQWWRAQRKLSLDDLATRAGISKSMISLIEQGRRSPSEATISKLLKGLSIPYTYLAFMVDGREALPPKVYEALALAAFETKPMETV